MDAGRRAFLRSLGAMLVGGAGLVGAALPAAAAGPAPEQAPFDLKALEPARWARVHEQRPSDAVTFVRQAHGGSAFDARRNRIVLFGSDTHGEDWTNSPLVFDVDRREWLRLYSDDSPSTYRVNADGLPVAGAHADHPWAMHTFGAIEYDERHDRLVVCSYPAHLEPGRFTNVLAHVWPSIRRHPTWFFHLQSERWEPLPSEAVHFFAYATAYDSDRHVVIGYRSDGVYELWEEPFVWRKVADRGLVSWGNNAAYDSLHKAVVVFGSTPASNDIVVYQPATGRHQIMPTKGLRPPSGRYSPMAFHPGLGKTVVVVDRTAEGQDDADRRVGRAETWLYDLGADEWTPVESAGMPFRVGMNYNLVYDSNHDVLWLVADPPDKPTTVFALRL